MNTLMEYLYRDAENCKVWNEAVLNGCLTDEQISQIYQSLDYSLYFVPHLVGLPEERFDEWDPESDHPYFELDEGWIRNVDRPPTVRLCQDFFAHLKRSFKREDIQRIFPDSPSQSV